MSMKTASITVAFVASTLLAIACTTTTTTTSSSSSSGSSGTDGGKDAGKSSSSSSSGSTDEEDSGTSTGGTCADESTLQACANCCASEYPKGAAAYQKAIFDCLCKPANCETECSATACAATPKDPDQACNTCLDTKQDSCQQEFSDSCSASSDCVDFAKCLQDNECAKKN